MKTKIAVRRFDYEGQITSVEKTPQGFLKVPGFVTRTGVFPYVDGMGKVRRELRHPDDVFDPASLATLRNAPVTLDHPPDMVSAENYDKYSKGYSGDRVEPNGNHLDCDLFIAHKDAIKAVEEDGLRELSAGYNADVEEEQGQFEGTPYDYRQKNIRYNHIAIVKQGRAGPEARLRMDSADAVMQSDEPETKEVIVAGETVSLPAHVADIVQSMIDRYDQMRGNLAKLEEVAMGKRTDMDINIKGISPNVDVAQGVPDGRGGAAKEMGSKAPQAMTDKEGQTNPFMKDADTDGKGTVPKQDDDMEDSELGASTVPGSAPMDQFAQMQAMIDQVQAMLDQVSGAGSGAPQMDADALAKKDADEDKEKDEKKDGEVGSKMSPKMDSAHRHTIRTRVKLEKLGEKLLPKSVSDRFDSMSDDQIRIAVIQHKHPKADLRGKSTVYLQTRFDSIAETLDESESVRKEMGSFLMSGRMDARENASPSDARSKMIADSKAQWKAPLSAVKK